MAIKIISETPVAMSELREELKKVRERDQELNFRAQKMEDYLNSLSMISLSKAKELMKKIEDLGIPRFKQEHMVKIADILPESPEEVKSVLSAYPITVTNENLKKIAETIKPYAEEARKELKKQSAKEEKERKEAAESAEQEESAESGDEGGNKGEEEEGKSGETPAESAEKEEATSEEEISEEKKE